MVIYHENQWHLFFWWISLGSGNSGLGDSQIFVKTQKKCWFSWPRPSWKVASENELLKHWGVWNRRISMYSSLWIVPRKMSENLSDAAMACGHDVRPFCFLMGIESLCFSGTEGWYVEGIPVQCRYCSVMIAHLVGKSLSNSSEKSSALQHFKF